MAGKVERWCEDRSGGGDPPEDGLVLLISTHDTDQIWYCFSLSFFSQCDHFHPPPPISYFSFLIDVMLFET